MTLRLTCLPVGRAASQVIKIKDLNCVRVRLETLVRRFFKMVIHHQFHDCRVTSNASDQQGYPC